jgi:uncharacterized protein (DUF58 family)
MSDPRLRLTLANRASAKLAARLKAELEKASRRRRERIYIVPTTFGALFLLGSAAMLLVGSAYANNLVNLLACFLMSLLLVAMIQTHMNVRDLRLAHATIDPGPAGGEVAATVTIENRGRAPKYSLEARAWGLELTRVEFPGVPLAGRATSRFRAAYRAGARGRKRVARIQISTVYPLGLFRAWSTRDVSAPYWVYPKPEGPLPLPVAGEGAGAVADARSSRPDASDFRGHRKSVPGDSHRRIDWKAYARGRPLLAKEFDGGAGQPTLAFSWQDTAALGPIEARLSQLAKWVESARGSGATFQLSIPGFACGPGHGSEHASRCLEALAAFDGERAA